MNKFINPVRNKFLNGVKNNFIFLLPILSGVFLILALPPYDLEFLIWVALIPFFWFLCLKQISPKKALVGGYLFGLVFFGKLMAWLLATYPFEWLGATKEKITVFTILLGILFAIQIAFLAIFPAIFSWFAKKFLSFESKLTTSSLFNLFAIPALWILQEYFRAWGFGILWLGKESLLGPHWTFGNLAYALHNKLAMIQIADIAGIYGISFLIVLINLILFLVIKNSRSQNFSAKHIIALFVLMGLISTLWTSYGIYKIKKSEITDSQSVADSHRVKKIALIQTRFLSGNEFNPYQKKEVFDAILDLFKLPESIQANPDFIIAPEGFGIISLTNDKKIVKYLLKDFWQSGQIYLENQKISDENKKVKSRLFYYDLEKETPLAYHDKMLLVPNGDFLPYITKLILGLYSFDIKYEQKFYNRGEKNEPVATPKGIIGGGICSSIISPTLNRQLTQGGAEFLAVVSSDAPFHGAKDLLAQNLAMSKLRAVENRRYFTQATNMGYSFLLDPKGKIIIKNLELGNAILFTNIALLNQKTIYTKFGDWIILFAILILGGIIINIVKKRNF